LDTGSAEDSTVADTSGHDGSVAGDSEVPETIADSADDGTTVVDSRADTVVVDSGADTIVEDTNKDSGADTSPSDTGTDTDAGCTKSGVCPCSDQTECAGTTFKCGGPSTCGGGTPCFTCNIASGTGGPGATCSDTTGCASGLCDNPRSRCSAPCKLTTAVAGDGDCTTAMGSGYACTEEQVSISSKSATLGYCAKKCAHDVDCGSDGCQLLNNDTYNRYDAVCGPIGTGAARGATCGKADDCASGICAGSPLQCTNLCTSAADCGGTLAKCTAQLFTLPAGGGTQSVKLCSP